MVFAVSFDIKFFSIFLFIKQQLQVRDHYVLMTCASSGRIFMKIDLKVSSYTTHERYQNCRWEPWFLLQAA